MQAAQQEQGRWRAQWEAEKQALQQEHDTLQHSIQVGLHIRVYVIHFQAEYRVTSLETVSAAMLRSSCAVVKLVKNACRQTATPSGP